VAQKKGREVEASGLGWELFRNYVVAKEKFKPDFFLYENNKSAAKPIKEQISRELGVDLMHINSALVSAQNRQRFYAFNWEVEQPEDRGILLKDILESGVVDREKAYPLLTTHQGNARDYFQKQHAQIAFEPVRLGVIESNVKNKAHDSKQYRVYSPDGKSTTLCGQGGGVGAKTGLYACPATGKESIVYEVKDGLITIKDKQYPIKLEDGLYIIRKLTVAECCRLQTLPDDYCRAVSNNQAYKGLGNGWTAEVIIHILNGALKDVPRDEEIVVLSMYDGIGTGRYCLDKMGFTNVKYYAYEIDKYAKEISMSNYPDIIQLGDAFDIRHPDWTIGY
jgi:DNA (cytosine-5)-methyltransferase 3A